MKFNWGFLLLSGSIAVSSSLAQVSEVEYRETYTQRKLSYSDKNSDGVITKEEAGNAWRWEFSAVDADGNEEVDAKEIANLELIYLDTSGEKKLNVLYKITEQENLYLDIYYPEGKVDEKLPIVVYTHGGGWAAGDKHGLGKGVNKKLFPKILEKGICVASVNYRRSKPAVGVYAYHSVEDSKDSIRFLAKNAKSLGIDPHKMMTIGNSAGGHLSLMNALTPNDVFVGDLALADVDYTIIGGVSWYGWTNLIKKELFIKESKPNIKNPIAGTASRVVPNHYSEAEYYKLLKSMSPSSYLHKDSPPIFLLHGDMDQTVIDKHSHYLHEKGVRVGANTKLLIVKGAAHGFGKKSIDPSPEAVWDATADFLADCL